jgi:hypothetical protein
MVRVAFLRVALLLIVAGLLSGCATARTGFDYATVIQKVGPPPPGQSRIVFLNEKATANAVNCEIAVDGKAAGDLTLGTYIYADRPAGKHQILATEALFAGETRQDIATVPGRTYFLLARPSERHRTVMASALMGGLTGALVGGVMTAGYKNPGPVDFVQLDDGAARSMLTELQLGKQPGQ